MFGYGTNLASITNLVGSTGIVASDNAVSGTARRMLAAAGFSYSA